MSVFDSASKKIHNLIGVTAAGQAAMAASVPVVIASDQSALQITRGVYGAELYALAARTADPTPHALKTNPGAKGMTIYVYVTALADTPSLILQLGAVSPTGANTTAQPQKVIWQSPAIVATGTYVYQLYPGAFDFERGSYPGLNGVYPIAIPYHWYLYCNAADSDSMTYQVEYDYIF